MAKGRYEKDLFFDAHCNGDSVLYVASSGAAHRPIAHCDNDAELLHSDGYLLPGRIIANVGIRERQRAHLLRSANAHPNSPNIDTNPNVCNMVHTNANTLHHLCAICGERKLINE